MITSMLVCVMIGQQPPDKELGALPWSTWTFSDGAIGLVASDDGGTHFVKPMPTCPKYLKPNEWRAIWDAADKTGSWRRWSNKFETIYQPESWKAKRFNSLAEFTTFKNTRPDLAANAPFAPENGEVGGYMFGGVLADEIEHDRGKLWGSDDVVEPDPIQPDPIQPDPKPTPNETAQVHPGWVVGVSIASLFVVGIPAYLLLRPRN